MSNVTLLLYYMQPLKKSKPDSISEVPVTENGQTSDDDDMITDDDVMANVTLSHGTITRALYGDEEGKVLSSEHESSTSLH